MLLHRPLAAELLLAFGAQVPVGCLSVFLEANFLGQSGH